VTVNVVDHVTLDAMNDAIICEGDTVQLTLTTDALKFTWTPAETLSDPAVENPLATPRGLTTYEVTASISSCTATDDIAIRTVPYPVVNAGADTSICFNTAAQLHATSDGSSFVWQPSSILNNPQSLDPVAQPLTSTSFILFAYDNKGCPKPGKDTVFVHVEAQIVPFAGNDTVVVVNQPLQMQATGGTLYQWTPSTGLSATNIANPIAKFSASPDEGYYRYKVVVSNETGCADSAYMQVKVFSSGPEIYVPTAFTPNSDGRNDNFQVVGAGIRSIQSFRIYNRWGQLVYDSPVIHSRGWDGVYGGRPQPPDTYVWMLQATDYLGRVIVKKGTVTLIR
jgi:gliding motility-associated-like protein